MATHPTAEEWPVRDRGRRGAGRRLGWGGIRVERRPVALCRCGARRRSRSATARTRRWASQAGKRPWTGSRRRDRATSRTRPALDSTRTREAATPASRPGRCRPPARLPRPRVASTTPVPAAPPIAAPFAAPSPPPRMPPMIAPTTAPAPTFVASSPLVASPSNESGLVRSPRVRRRPPLREPEGEARTSLHAAGAIDVGDVAVQHRARRQRGVAVHDDAWRRRARTGVSTCAVSTRPRSELERQRRARRDVTSRHRGRRRGPGRAGRLRATSRRRCRRRSAERARR